MIPTLIFIVIAYLIGSLCSAIIVCKLLNLPDPRMQGSKNPGATNVLRIAGKLPALITLVADILKGFLPVLIAHIFNIQGLALGLVAIAALLGHIFPIFFGFQGGKGVATALGACLGLSLLLGIAMIITWIIVAAIFRYSSLAALAAAILAPIYVAIFTHGSYFIPVLIITCILIWRHWPNIQRLRSGNESKISF